MEVKLHVFLTSVLDEGEWTVPCFGCFMPGERGHVTHWTGCWMDPRDTLDIMVKTRILCLPIIKT